MTVVPRALRMNLLVRLIMPWRLPAWAVMTLPVAGHLEALLGARLRLHLGHFRLLAKDGERATRHATLAGRAVGEGRIEALGPLGKWQAGYATAA
jgi:hypothetical protein